MPFKCRSSSEYYNFVSCPISDFCEEPKIEGPEFSNIYTILTKTGCNGLGSGAGDSGTQGGNKMMFLTSNEQVVVVPGPQKPAIGRKGRTEARSADRVRDRKGRYQFDTENRRYSCDPLLLSILLSSVARQQNDDFAEFSAKEAKNTNLEGMWDLKANPTAPIKTHPRLFAKPNHKDPRHHITWSYGDDLKRGLESPPQSPGKPQSSGSGV